MFLKIKIKTEKLSVFSVIFFSTEILFINIPFRFRINIYLANNLNNKSGECLLFLNFL